MIICDTCHSTKKVKLTAIETRKVELDGSESWFRLVQEHICVECYESLIKTLYEAIKSWKHKKKKRNT